MDNVKMHANYLRRVATAVVILVAIGLVIHAAVKYRRYPFGIGSTSYRLARSSNYVETFFETPDEFVGGLYDAGSDGNEARPVSRGRSLDKFCLDGSPLPPKPTPAPSSIVIDRNNGDGVTTTANTPSYHILNSNFSSTISLDTVANAIRSKYNDLLQATLINREHGNCRPTIIEYRCSQPKCGGFGDRLRGMAATFFIALLTNSVFSLNWDYPVNLETYFETSLMPRKLLLDKFYPSASGVTPSEIVIRAIDEEEDLIWLLSDITRLRHVFRKYGVIAFEINSLVPLEVLLSHPYFRSLADFYDVTNFSYSEIFSIALRILLPHYTPRLSEAVAPYDAMLQSPKYDARFGIQIRLGSKKWNEFQRVNPSQLQCFIDEIDKIRKENSYKNLLIFVTADNDDALKGVERLSNKTFMSAAKVISASGVADITHIDRTKFRQDAKMEGLRTFADWAILSSPRLDHLLISRSGFGETAGMFRMSAKSIRRLAHNITDGCVFNDYAMTSVWMEDGAVPSSTSTSCLLITIVVILWQNIN